MSRDQVVKLLAIVSLLFSLASFIALAAGAAQSPQKRTTLILHKGDDRYEFEPENCHYTSQAEYPFDLALSRVLLAQHRVIVAGYDYTRFRSTLQELYEKNHIDVVIIPKGTIFRRTKMPPFIAIDDDKLVVGQPGTNDSSQDYAAWNCNTVNIFVKQVQKAVDELKRKQYNSGAVK